MLLPIPEDILQAQARERALDMILSGVGISAAVVSASFAAYMVAVAPMHPRASRSEPLIAMSGPPSHAPRKIAPQNLPADGGTAPQNGIDFDPTGTIPGLPEDVTQKPEAQANARSILTDFAVRDVFDGTALVEDNGTLRMVRPGSELPGAGTVTSVTRQGNGWVVATTGGLILQRH